MFVVVNSFVKKLCYMCVVEVVDDVMVCLVVYD